MVLCNNKNISVGIYNAMHEYIINLYLNDVEKLPKKQGELATRLFNMYWSHANSSGVLDSLLLEEIHLILRGVKSTEPNEVSVKDARKAMSLLVMECPVCGVTEHHPTQDGVVQLRGNKVYDQGVWWSQCLVCSGGYDKPNGVFTEANHDPSKGWFHL